MQDVSGSLKILGAAIRERRHALNLSQEELALRAGVDRSYIGQVERGERNMSLSNLVKIARALGTSASSLLEGIH